MPDYKHDLHAVHKKPDEKPKVLHIDIETKSSAEISKSGVRRYAEDKDFAILLYAYAFDDQPVTIIDLACGEELPDWMIEYIRDASVTKVAYNAMFERTCLSVYLGEQLSPDGWKCTMVQACYLSLPLSLEGCAEALKTVEQKDKEGHDLIRYFCVPCKPTKLNSGRTWNLPEHAPEKWDKFKYYCCQDVETERDIEKKISLYPISPHEMELYRLDQRINDRGVLVDMELVKQAIACDVMHSETATARAYELTGCDNPNSVSQLKGWLSEQGVEIDSLSKKAVKQTMKELEKNASSNAEAIEVLALRAKMAKSSVKKYEAAARSVCKDGRIHGCFQFMGANRTGRWAGRLVQLQNLPQNHIETLAEARTLVRMGEFGVLEMIYENTPDVLSQLIRTMFIPKLGCRFIVADFSQIEARVLAWMAGEQWRLDVFREGKDIYCASASQMFHVPVEKHGINGELRTTGKVAELALGYGGGVGAMKSMGAIDKGLKEEELPDIIKQWRAASPAITKFWWDVDRAANKALDTGKMQTAGRLKIGYYDHKLFICLPSGRKLAYIEPEKRLNSFNRMELTYMGVGKTRKWERIMTYGPKLVENCIQAIARDILAEAMLRVDATGFDIVAHVHDEMIVEVPNGKSSVKELCDMMAESPDWVDDKLPLRADGYECEWYRKD